MTLFAPVSQLFCVLLHALVLRELHQLAGSSAHVDRRGPRGRQVAQRVPDKGNEVVTSGTRPQFHCQAQAPHDGDSGSTSHLRGERSRDRESERHFSQVMLFKVMGLNRGAHTC